MTVTATATELIIAKLTAKGRETMTAVGAGKMSFFDNGICAGSGTWGYCFTNELGHKSSGVANRLAELGLFDVSDSDEGTWFALTELGADVALTLAGQAEAAEVAADVAPAAYTSRVGRKWITLYDRNGDIMAEIRQDEIAAIKAYLA